VGTFTLFAWLISHQPAVLFSHNKPATSNQLAVLFSQNKPAPAISHQPTEQAVVEIWFIVAGGRGRPWCLSLQYLVCRWSGLYTAKHGGTMSPPMAWLFFYNIMITSRWYCSRCLPLTTRYVLFHALSLSYLLVTHENVWFKTVSCIDILSRWLGCLILIL
jgi:hypothetical protein